MKRVLVIAPGPLEPGRDAGVASLAALATLSFASRGIEVVTLSPSPTSPVLTFVERAYAEAVTGDHVRDVARRENVDAVFALFGGDGAVRAAVSADIGVPVLGFPRKRGSLAALLAGDPDDFVRPEETRVVIELARDAQGTSVVYGAFTASGEGTTVDAVLRMPALARGVPWSSAIGAAALAVTQLVEGTDVSGVFSFTCAVTSAGAARIVERNEGARFSTVAAARAIRWPVADIAVRIALGETLREIEIDGHAATSSPPWPEAIRKPVLAFGRFPGARPALLSGAVGQSLRVVERRARGATSASASTALVVLGAGPHDIDQTGAAALWAGVVVHTARASGRTVTVIDDDPGSIAGSLADRWILAPPSSVLEHFDLRGCDVLTLASPAAREMASSLEAAGAHVRDCSQGAVRGWEDVLGGRAKDAPGGDRAERDGEEARKLDVAFLCDAESARIVGFVEYVESANVHVADSAAFTPPQTIALPTLEGVERASRRLLASIPVSGLVTLTWHLHEEPRLADVVLGPASSVPLLSHATGLHLAALATRLALGASLAALGVVDIPEPSAVTARETAFPRGLLAGTSIGLGPTKRSIGEAIGVAETMASAYKKALGGVGLWLERGRGAVLLSPSSRDVRDVVATARKLHPLGFRIFATSEAADLLRKLRVPFEHVDDEVARRELASRRVVLAVITGIGQEARAATLRHRALAAGIPCFTSALLFRAACAAIEEGVSAEVRPLPRGPT